MFFRVLPESARWLLAQGKFEKAEEVIKKVAKVNHKNLPENIFSVENNEGLLTIVSTVFKIRMVFFVIVAVSWLVGRFTMRTILRNQLPSGYRTLHKSCTFVWFSARSVLNIQLISVCHISNKRKQFFDQMYGFLFLSRGVMPFEL